MEDYQQASMYEAEKVVEIRPFLLGRRLFVLGLYGSFLGCLVALWLTGTLFGHPDQVLPDWLMQGIESSRYIVLAVPLICLAACYGGLRYVTAEIMGCPERFLDERQKMVRDRAHRSAYKVMKLGALLVPLAICAGAMFLPARTPAPVPAPVRVQPARFVFYVSAGSGTEDILLLGPDGQAGSDVEVVIVKSAPQDLQGVNSHDHQLIAPALGNVDDPATLSGPGMQVAWAQATTLQRTSVAQQNLTDTSVLRSWPNDPAEISIYYGTLLLGLFLVASALPMSMVAWMERM